MVDIKPVTSVTTPTAIDDLSLHDALPIYEAGAKLALGAGISDDVCGWLLQIRERFDGQGPDGLAGVAIPIRSEEHTSELQSLAYLVCRLVLEKNKPVTPFKTPVPLADIKQ